MKTLRLIFLVSLVNFSLVVGIFGTTRWGKKGLVNGEEKTVVVVMPTKSPLIVATPVILVTPIEVPKDDTVVDNRCIIVIDGVSYDVTEFREIHSGGNIFNCGTDVSGLFHGRHPESYLEIMAKYKI